MVLLKITDSFDHIIIIHYHSMPSFYTFFRQYKRYHLDMNRLLLCSSYLCLCDFKLNIQQHREIDWFQIWNKTPPNNSRNISKEIHFSIITDMSEKIRMKSSDSIVIERNFSHMISSSLIAQLIKNATSNQSQSILNLIWKMKIAHTSCN